ncbi:MAG: IreB family regulatory phosphoprotein [Oscillospiraceae bacterium]
MKDNSTMIFNIFDDKPDEIKISMQEIYAALKEKGYNPINQIVGYILSEDPTYITTHQGARNKIQKIDRDELLHALLESYLKE